MPVKQLSLFPDEQPDLVFRRLPTPPKLNGFYYETATKKFVSFSGGRRFYEIHASRCQLPKKWQQKIMTERSI